MCTIKPKNMYFMVHDLLAHFQVPPLPMRVGAHGFSRTQTDVMLDAGVFITPRERRRRRQRGIIKVDGIRANSREWLAGWLAEVLISGITSIRLGGGYLRERASKRATAFQGFHPAEMIANETPARPPKSCIRAGTKKEKRSRVYITTFLAIPA